MYSDAPYQRALKATAQLEEGWHVEWTGWKMMPQWPLKTGQWWCIGPEKEYYLVESWAADTENSLLTLQHLQDECRLRLRMLIYQHNVIEKARAAHETAGDDPSPPGSGS